MILLLHAYSRNNSGDGLLVDLSLRLIEKVAEPGEELVVVASDSASFGDLHQVVQVPATDRCLGGRIQGTVDALRAVAPKLVPAPLGSMDRLAGKARLVLGVGGGYLRAGHLIEATKTALTHLPQLAAAARAKAPSVYLPQSIGPLRGPVGTALRRQLEGVDHVFVRDDTTLSELGEALNVERFPDLAVLAVGETPPKHGADSSGPVVIVARELRQANTYEASLRQLGRAFPDAIWAVQSEGRRNNDPAFYAALGLTGATRSLKEVVRSEPTGVIISVRLHGAIESILAGWPAVHLSYERKGQGAYADLRLSPFVHDARRIDTDLVVDQVHALRADTSAYWAQVDVARSALQADYTRLAQEIRALL